MSQLGGAHLDAVRAVALAPDTRVIVAAETHGAPAVDGKPIEALAAAPPVDLAVVSAYDKRGRLVWADGLAGGGASPATHAMAVAADGSIFVAGAFSGHLGLLALHGVPPIESAAGHLDAYVLALNADGQVRWLRRFATAAGSSGNALLPAPDGGVYFAGGFEPDASVSKLSGGQAILLHVAADGRILWKIAVEGNATALTLAAAPDGGYLLMSYHGRTTLDVAARRRSFTARGPNDALMLRFNRNGHVVAACPIGSAEPDTFTALASTVGEVAIGGYFSGNRELFVGNSRLHLVSDGSSALVLRLTPDLTLRGHLQTSGAGPATLEDLAYDNGGRLWCAGSFRGSLTLGPDTFVAEDGDAWLAAYMGDRVSGAIAFSGRGTQQVLGIAPDNRGGAYVAGAFTKELAVRGQRTAPVAWGASDGFVAHVTADTRLARRKPERQAHVGSDED